MDNDTARQDILSVFGGDDDGADPFAQELSNRNTQATPSSSDPFAQEIEDRNSQASRTLSPSQKASYSRQLEELNFIAHPVGYIAGKAMDIAKGYGNQLISSAQSAKDLLTGNYDAPLAPSQQTQELVSKVKSGTATLPDYSNALLGQVENSPFGKFANVVSGIIPGYNIGAGVVNNLINPAVENVTGVNPSNLQAGELIGGTAIGAMMAPKGSGKSIASPYRDYAAQGPKQPPLPVADNLLLRSLDRDTIAPTDATNKLSAMGPDAMLADAGGENTRGLARAVGNMPGPAREIAVKALEERQAGQPDRIRQATLQGLGVSPEDTYGDVLTKLDKQQSATASPLYQEAFQANKNVSSPIIDRILETDAGQQALRFAATRMNNRMALMGVPDPELAEQAKLAGSYKPGGIASGLKLETLDLVKQGLDDQIGVKLRAGENGAAYDLINLKNGLMKELDANDVTAKAGPNSYKPEGGSYARARATYADKASAKEALDAGYDYLTKGDESALGSIEEAQKPYFRIGIANKISDIIQNTPDGADAVKRIFGSPAKRAKLQAVFPDAESFKQFEETVNNEKEFTKTYQAVTKGSRTAPLAEDISDTSTGLNKAAQTAQTIGRHAVELGQRNAVGRVLYGAGHLVNKMTEPSSMTDNDAIALANKLFTPNSAREAITLPDKPMPRNTLVRSYINYLAGGARGSFHPSALPAGGAATQRIDNAQ